MNINDFRNKVNNRHDIICNQKYSESLPYSFHLYCVEQQGKKFLHLIEDKEITNPNNKWSSPCSLSSIVIRSLIAHDLIEDGRMTYNDLKNIIGTGNSYANEMVADIVYCVTDEKGKTRSERKNDKYYKELSENDLAVFVKLSDIAANTLFSKLTGSSMYDKYKVEFGHFKEMCYKEKYDDFFKYVENL